VLISILLLRSSHWPNGLGYFGLIVAASLLLNLLEMIGIDMGAMMTASETLQHFWMLATAIVFLGKKTLYFDNHAGLAIEILLAKL
jgi:hypothetical protein